MSGKGGPPGKRKARRPAATPRKKVLNQRKGGDIQAGWSREKRFWENAGRLSLRLDTPDLCWEKEWVTKGRIESERGVTADTKLVPVDSQKRVWDRARKRILPPGKIRPNLSQKEKKTPNSNPSGGVGGGGGGGGGV